MLLHHRLIGAGTPVVLLHGLFGSGDNLNQLAQELAAHHQVISLDLRNHGRSPHDPLMSYPLMAQDVVETLNQLGVNKADIIGHSMGGKVAMQLALQHAKKVNRLIVVDIAPVTYSAHHHAVFRALDKLNQQLPIASRKAADAILAAEIDTAELRQFLLKNLVTDDEGEGLVWRIGYSAIRQQYPQLLKAPSGPLPYTGSTLFIRGGDSDFILPDHRMATLHAFPKAQLREIPGAGHWLHVEKPRLFNAQVLRFLDDSQPEHANG